MLCIAGECLHHCDEEARFVTWHEPILFLPHSGVRQLVLHFAHDDGQTDTRPTAKDVGRDSQEARLAALIAARPDATLAELRDALATTVELSTLWRAIDRLGFTGLMWPVPGRPRRRQRISAFCRLTVRTSTPLNSPFAKLKDFLRAACSSYL